MHPDAITRGFAEAEAADQSMKDPLSIVVRKELGRELGNSRPYLLEEFVPTNARQKAVQGCMERIVDEWSSVPSHVAALPEFV